MAGRGGPEVAGRGARGVVDRQAVRVGHSREGHPLGGGQEARPRRGGEQTTRVGFGRVAPRVGNNAGVLGAAVVLGGVVLLAGAAPAGAHGIGGGRGDLPLPAWMFAYGAGAAVVVSFAALRLLWPTARFERRADGAVLADPSRALGWGAVASRALGLAAFALVLLAAVVGDDDPTDNLAPTAVYVVFWVGLQVLSALVGDVWRLLDPFDTLAALVDRRRTGERRPPAATVLPTALAYWRAAGLPDPRTREGFRRPYSLGHWPAAAGLFGFVWLELVHPSASSPRVLAVAIAGYALVVLAGAAWWGRPWVREGEAFAAYFGLLAAMAPLRRDGAGRRRLRPPLAGLAGLEVRPGTEALVLVALGSTTYDGLSRTRLWADVVAGRAGWAAVPYGTAGLVAAVGVVALAYTGSMRLAARTAGRDPLELRAWFVPSLVPIALAYAVAHYFSLLVFEGQGALALASDPFGRGWDLFGTATRAIDYRAVSPRAIALVQAFAIVVGHVAAVVVAHDRSVARFPAALAARAQYPLLGVMVLYTVGGLGLLLNA